MLFEDRVLYHEHADVEGPPERLLMRWPRSDPSHIWIPSRLLPDRNRRDQSKKSAFHMLQRYESRDFENSFSVYSDSDSEEEYFHDYAERSNPLFADSFDSCSHRNLVAELPDRRYVDGFETSDGCSDDIATVRSPDRRTDHVLPEEPSDRLEENGFLESGSDVDVTDKDEISAPIEAEFLYGKKKPLEDTFEKKTASKREKRNKTRAKITMPLDHFWQTVETNGHPDEDAFYRSLMEGRQTQKGISCRPVGVNDTHEFPGLDVFPDDGRERAPSPIGGAGDIGVSADEEGAAQHGEEERLESKVLVMANIPEDVDREMVEDLVSDYGQLSGMERGGGSWTAEFWIPPDVELDWLISCFDGHQPFGAYSSVLHCFEKES